MTVTAQVPVIEYVGNGVTTDFPFTWSSGDPSEIYCKQDGKLLVEGIEYELTEYTLAFGGTLVFNEAPKDGSIILVYRDTPVTQELDYVDGDAFPAETHEFQLDKDTRILQEIIEGGRAVGGRVDLTGVQYPEYVEIDNTAGQNAIILPWTTEGLNAGAALGEVIDFGGTPPTDTEPTDKKDGYIWWVLGEPVDAGGDATVVMFASLITVATSKIAPIVPRAEFRFTLATGEISYGYDSQQPLEEPVWTTEAAVNPAPSLMGTYWIRMAVVNGTFEGDAVDTWFDATSEPTRAWFTTSGIASGVFSVAPDDGAGNPDPDYAISRRVVLSSEQL